MFSAWCSLPKISLRATWQKLKSINARIENSFVGDLLGCLCLIGIMVTATWLLPLIYEVFK